MNSPVPPPPTWVPAAGGAGTFVCDVNDTDWRTGGGGGGGGGTESNDPGCCDWPKLNPDIVV